MSKFFGVKGDSSSSSSESDSDNEKNKQAQKQKGKTKKFYGGDSDDNDDEEQRVIVKKTDKLHQALLGVFDKMKNHINIGDFSALQVDFDDIQTEIQKCIATSVFATDKY